MNSVLKNMYEDGMPLSDISDKTGYTVEECIDDNMLKRYWIGL